MRPVGEDKDTLEFKKINRFRQHAFDREPRRNFHLRLSSPSSHDIEVQFRVGVQRESSDLPSESFTATQDFKMEIPAEIKHCKEALETQD